MGRKGIPEPKTVGVFEFKPGWKRRGWIHYKCADKSYRAGKFHAPVIVPIESVNGENCVLCRKPIVVA